MKIESRVELDSKRFGRYKLHAQTSAERGIDALGINLISAYVPKPGDRPDAAPSYYLTFGMDGRRFVLTLDHAEAQALRDQLDEKLKLNGPRRIK